MSQDMAPQRTINVLISTFTGLDLPPTLNLPLPSTSTISHLHNTVATYIPSSIHRIRNVRLSIHTSNSQALSPTSTTPLSALVPHHTAFLPLHLHVPTLGGKGGFGSQLRAAGGRMSSRKKRGGGPVPNSNRNLDGRRVRTVGEAKALAEYLAVRPEMEKREKEERRKRWEEVVEAADRREEEIREGKARKTVDGKWAEDKEEAEGRMRDAVARAMADGLVSRAPAEQTEGGSSEESAAGSEGSDGSDEVDDSAAVGVSAAAKGKGRASGEQQARRVWGWDEEDEDMSDNADEGSRS